jgi:hypothetical protein
MAKSIRVITKQLGRPKTTGKGRLFGVRLHAPQIALLDAWIAEQHDKPSRPEAIRRLIALGLPVHLVNGDKPARKKK